MKFSRLSFQKERLLSMLKLALVICTFIVGVTLHIVSNFSVDYSPSWDTVAFYISEALLLLVIFLTCLYREQDFFYRWLWAAAVVYFTAFACYECFSAATHININYPYIHFTLLFIAVCAIIVSLVFGSFRLYSIREDRITAILQVLKPLAIVLFFLAFNFVYAFPDYSHSEPLRQWDTAGYYLMRAAQYVLFFAMMWVSSKEDYYRRIWIVLTAFSSVRIIALIYAVIFGADIYAKSTVGILFYVTLGLMFYFRIIRRDTITKTNVT